MSTFEIVMLLCFGAAWPFSIYQSWASRKTTGKSILFLIMVLVGYAAGIANKILYRFDGAVYLYVLNSLMVAADIALYYRNKVLERDSRTIPAEPSIHRAANEGSSLDSPLNF
ncbi:MAG: hypothetical protein E4H20_05075 [Spirochaetales bacterium]|nr:MAG: hypothetical protein E4H20_05075 [Spirochaetales bacterium]